jgi:hypothetical protein
VTTQPAQQMTCIEVVEVVSDYLERSLGVEERVRLEAHLVICEGCDAYVAQMRATVAALGRLDEGARPSPHLESVVVAFRARHR